MVLHNSSEETLNTHTDSIKDNSGKPEHSLYNDVTYVSFFCLSIFVTACSEGVNGNVGRNETVNKSKMPPHSGQPNGLIIA